MNTGKIVLNREFAMRHLGVALLMAGLSGWFCYDGAVTYPAREPASFAEEHGARIEEGARLKKQAIDRQFQFAGIALVAALVIAGGVWRAKRKTLAWDETTMTGTLTGGKPLAFSDVASVDYSKWDTKRILTVQAKDGRKMTLDAWHHLGVKDLEPRFTNAKV